MFRKIRNLLQPQRQDSSQHSATAQAVINTSAIDRAKAVYGEDRINRQRLFEQWSCQDSWHLRREGIPLLLGMDPEAAAIATDNTAKQSAQALWEHAVDCVNKRLLVVVNPDTPADEWRVTPSALYCWATVGRVSVPQELSALMDFVLQTVRSSPSQTQQETVANDEQQHHARYLKHCEIALGAALSLLANSPETFKSSRGNVKAGLLAAEILVNQEVWFGKDEPMLARAAMEDLISRYIAKSRLPVG